MTEVKIVIGEKTGKSYQKVLESQEPLLGRSIGDTFKGDLIGIPGYEFSITGGSDDSGFAMRRDIKGTRRVRILGHSGTGLKVKVKGKLIRKTVAGNTIHEKTNQVNIKVSKEGTKKLSELFGKETPAEGETVKEANPDEKKD